jgi:hypothetical protein
LPERVPAALEGARQCLKAGFSGDEASLRAWVAEREVDMDIPYIDDP